MKGSSQFLDDKFTCIELGLVPDHDMMITILNASDIVLMPSEAESFGMMAVESMACGTPVIVFNGTALETVVHSPVSGVSVPKDGLSLQCAIENLLNNPDKYNTIVRNGLDLVKSDYNGDNCSKFIMNLYSKMINEH
jgi:glycosyltransferase involved in cell wall biosynthesis